MFKDNKNKLARRNLTILILAQATVGNQMVMIFIIGGLAGQSLVTNPCFATLPISLIVLGSMLSANPLSLIMQKYGRRMGFLLGTLGGASGGIIGCIGLYLSDFSIFLIGSFLSGIYMSAQGFYRFAATDTASPEFKPKAISYVMAGGLISAIIGPQLVKLTSSSFIIPFLGTYLTVILLNLVGAFLFLYLKSDSDIYYKPMKKLYDTLKTENGNSLAYIYDYSTKNKHNLIWFGGLNSDMYGTKAEAVSEYASLNNLNFCRFDYCGHGISSGNFEDFNISDWLNDSISILDNICKGQQIFVGSSMGGWISLLLALKRKKRVNGLVLIAPAVDMTEILMWNNFSNKENAAIFMFPVNPLNSGDL